MKIYATIFIALMAVALVLGCTGGGAKKEAGTGQGYTVSVTPTEVIAGGTATVDLRITNPFERSMKKVTVTTPEISYQVDGQLKDGTVEILPKQTYPALMTLNIPQTAFGEIREKSIKVCFNYVTDYYFDVAKKSKDGTETFSTSQGQTTGPITVTTTGLDTLYIENAQVTGSLAIANNWIGSIEKINNISATFTSGIKTVTMKVGNCKSSATKTSSNELSSVLSGCSVLGNKNLISSGVTVLTTVEQSDATSGVQRVQGTVDLDYCYKVPLTTITIKTVP